MSSESMLPDKDHPALAGSAPSPATMGMSGAVQGITSTFEQMSALVGRFADAAKAAACIGPAQNLDGHTVIPVASVSLQAGFGMGFGGGEGGEGATQGQGGGGGGGGGGRANSRVLAVVDVSDQGVNVRPVPDITAIVIGVLAVAGLALLTARGRTAANSRRLLSALKPER